MVNEKRLIDVWDLIEWLDNFDRENTLRILRGKKAKILNSHAIRNMIVNATTVDAVEVVHGHWELYPSSMYRRCSVCKVEYEKPKFNVRANYCPNCGARMDLQ